MRAKHIMYLGTPFLALIVMSLAYQVHDLQATVSKLKEDATSCEPSPAFRIDPHVFGFGLANNRDWVEPQGTDKLGELQGQVDNLTRAVDSLMQAPADEGNDHERLEVLMNEVEQLKMRAMKRPAEQTRRPEARERRDHLQSGDVVKFNGAAPTGTWIYPLSEVLIDGQKLQPCPASSGQLDLCYTVP
jgi:hypothetical protein